MVPLRLWHSRSSPNLTLTGRCLSSVISEFSVLGKSIFYSPIGASMAATVMQKLGDTSLIRPKGGDTVLLDLLKRPAFKAGTCSFSHYQKKEIYYE